VITNDSPEVPFPSLYDFISEINRPPDSYTMANLKFNYQIADLKNNLQKHSRPQDIVDGINLRLTRLDYWRNILLNAKDTYIQSNPYLDIETWSEEVIKKYQSLKTMANMDMKKAIDSQYDKRFTFINIIDQWSDRLKRKFKSHYQARAMLSRPPLQPWQLSSVWRKNMEKLVNFTTDLPYLTFHPPVFQPSKLLEEVCFNRSEKYTEGYLAVIDYKEVLQDLSVWLRDMQNLFVYSQHPALEKGQDYQTINQITISKGYLAEHVMRDLWEAVDHWLSPDKDTAAISAAILFPDDDDKHPLKSSQYKDHLDSYLSFLKGVNSFIRSESMSNRKSVKELFKTWHEENRETLDWWTSVVTDLGIENEFSKDYLKKKRPISELIDDYLPMDDDGNVQIFVGSTAQDQEIQQKYATQWKNDHKPGLIKAEALYSILPWISGTNNDRDISNKLIKRSINTAVEVRKQELKDDKEVEMMHIPVIRPIGQKQQQALFFALPRLYRAINDATELVSVLLNALIDFINLIWLN
jgi:hypothetical protein